MTRDGVVTLDDPAAFRAWAKAFGASTAHGVEDRILIVADEAWSGDARKFYWKILRALEVQTDYGMTQRDWNDELLRRFTDVDSITKLTRTECSAFLDDVILCAAEHGVVVPEPNPLHALCVPDL